MTINVDSFPNVATLSYVAVRPLIKSGDILLFSGYGSVVEALIKAATQSVWSHIAFILRLDAIDRIMVLESVVEKGVRAVPLSSYVSNHKLIKGGHPGKLLIARHQQLDPKNISKLSRTAIDLLGYPYSMEANIRAATRIFMRTFEGAKNTAPLKDSDALNCAEYVHKCYRSIGLTVDYNAEGFIAPADFARNPWIEAVNFIKTQASASNKNDPPIEIRHVARLIS